MFVVPLRCLCVFCFVLLLVDLLCLMLLSCMIVFVYCDMIGVVNDTVYVFWLAGVVHIGCGVVGVFGCDCVFCDLLWLCV